MENLKNYLQFKEDQIKLKLLVIQANLNSRTSSLLLLNNQLFNDVVTVHALSNINRISTWSSCYGWDHRRLPSLWQVLTTCKLPSNS
jgi:hypothetical protein